MHTMNMADISKILESAVISDDRYDTDDDDVISQYYISEVVRKDKKILSNIVKWEYQLSRIIYNLHLKNTCTSSIVVEDLMVDNNLNIVGDSLSINTWSDHPAPEAVAINAIINIHKCLFKHVLLICKSKEYTKKIKILQSVADYYFAVNINVNSRVSVNDLTKSILQLYRMVDLGFIEQLSNSYTINNNI